jgi:formylglycine-generating enzyme required for sulfatase activity
MSRQDDLRQLISNHQRRLQKLKEQQALMGMHTPPYISIEIEDTEAELNRLSDELAGLRGATPPREETPPALAGPQVFISYSRRDIEFVQKLAADLERAGLTTWWDVSKLEGGDDWEPTIQAALEQSRYCLVVLSPDSVKSRWVRREYQYAEKLELKIVPLLYWDCQQPLGLIHLQHIDFRGNNYELGLRNLLSIVKPKPTPPIEKLASASEAKPTLSLQVAGTQKKELPPLLAYRPEEPELVLIPAGEFWMGSDFAALEKAKLVWQDWMNNETPRHRLYLPYYFIGCYPVTNAEYDRFIEDAGYRQRELWTEAGWRQKEQEKWTQPRWWIDKQWNQPNYPVVGVSWYEAAAYGRWLERLTNRSYRLPTEAEWEKAARGPQENIWPWGNIWQPELCNLKEKGLGQTTGQTTPVGKYAPVGDSPYGVADMAGNVWEWCATRFEGKFKPYPYNVKENEGTPNYLSGDSLRVLRGGSWSRDLNYARCAYRYRFNPGYRDADIGFRVVVSPISPASAL